MKNNEEFLTTREAAKILGVSLRTVQLWVENGVLSAWKTAGGHRRIVRASLDEILQRKKDAIDQQDSSKVQVDKSRMKLLIVEDSSELLTLYRRHITLWNLPLLLLTAADGYDGLFQIGQNQPDFIISDLEMPGMDGVRMIWALHEQPDLKKKDLVVVTALTTEEIIARGGLPDNVRVFSKPIPFDELKSMVTKKLKQMTASP